MVFFNNTKIPVTSMHKRVETAILGVKVCQPSKRPDRAFRSLIYGLSLRIQSIRCFWSGKMSYNFLLSSVVSEGDRCGGGEGDDRGRCQSGGPECGQREGEEGCAVDCAAEAYTDGVARMSVLGGAITGLPL